jgi:predicted TIM-barrel fold metal-dependent hydrolase
MQVIDIDSHFMEPFTWFEDAFPEIHAKCPPVPLVEMVVEALMGDLVTALPPGVALGPRDLLPTTLLDMLDHWTELEDKVRAGNEAARAELEQIRSARALPPSQYDGDARRAWIDEQGIDVQVVLPTLGYFPYRAAMKAGMREEAFEALGAYNTWAADQLAGHTDRLIPVTLVDLSDLEWSLSEIRRMRERGSRVVQIKAEPVGGKSLAHPDFDRLWSLFEDLDIAVMLHVGGGRVPVDTGWLDNGGHPLDLTAMYGTYVRRLVPELTLSALILRGVLEHHPKLRFFVAELGAHWVPEFGPRLDALVDRTQQTASATGRSFAELQLKPSEYFARHVRVAALASESGLDDTLARSPDDVIVYSSDYPHPEGTKSPTDVFDDLLADASTDTRERFYGRSVADFAGF